MRKSLIQFFPAYKVIVNQATGGWTRQGCERISKPARPMICWAPARNMLHGLRWMRGANQTDLAIETGAVAGTSLCGSQRGAAGPLVGGELLAHGRLDAGFEPAAGSGGPPTRRSHAGWRICRRHHYRQPDVFHSDLSYFRDDSLRPLAHRLDTGAGGFLLADISTRLGREQKLRLGTAE